MLRKKKPGFTDRPIEYWKGTARIFLKRVEHPGWKIMIDMEASDNLNIRDGVHEGKTDGVTMLFDRTDKWTEWSSTELQRSGYQKAERIPPYDSILLWGVPVYVRLHGLRQYDVHHTPIDGDIRKDTATTLNDVMQTSAVNTFIKGLAHANSMSHMDIQKLVMAGIVAVGAIFGLHLLGVF